VVACHQIGAFLYQLDDGQHKHSLHEEWLERELQESNEGKPRYHFSLPPTAFFHARYRAHEQYPRGLADVVGYWAEGKIFGGVVVFDRGESGREVSCAPC
jgi:hypothetical protein